MNIKVGILAAIGSFAGSALGAHIVLMLSDEVLQMMMFIILPIAAVSSCGVAISRTRTGTTAP